MFKLMKNFLAVVGALTVFGFVVACFDSSNADSGDVTQAELDALEARIEALESASVGLTGNVLTASAATSVAGQSKQSAVGDICSVLDYNPAGGFPGTMEKVACKSSTGYLLSLPITDTANPVRPSPLDDSRVYFESADCTGQPYVHPDQVGDMGIQQGSVFEYHAGESLTGYVAAGSQTRTDLMITSGWSYFADQWNCVQMDVPGQLHAVAVLPNDATVTGVEDSYVGPVSMF